jgi:hypothetical protein
MKKMLLLALTCATLPVAAQQSLPKTSGDPLKEICTGFLEQGGAGVSGDRNKLCTCLVRETQAGLTPQEMAIYSKAAETGQAPPPAIMNKVMNIATTCLTAAR